MTRLIGSGGGSSYPSISETNGAVTIGIDDTDKMHTLNGYVREISPVPDLSTSGNEVLNCAIQSTFRKTGGDAIITLSGMEENQNVSLLMESVGSVYTLTWSGYTFHWPWSSIPTPTTTSGRYDLYNFIKINDVVYGSATIEYGS